MNPPPIPVNEPRLTAVDRAWVLRALDEGWVSSEGPYVAQFEAAMATRLERRHAVAVSSGTAALQLAFEALDLEPGDEVLMPSFTIISCVQAVLNAGLTPVLVDSDPVTWSMDPEHAARRVTPRTRAIMPVHIYGLPAALAPLMELADRHALKVVEDAAEGLGIKYRGRPCGSFGDVSTLSFYANKLVTTGEGGMVLTDDDHIAERVRSLRNLCFEPRQRFVHESLGWNYRMTSLQAALGLGQLEAFDDNLARKRRVGHRYDETLASLPGITTQPAQTADAQSAYWVYGVLLHDDHPLDARAAMTEFATQGIGTRPFFWPMHEQPALLKMGLFAGDRHPVSSRLARRGFYLPSGLGLTDAQQERVIEATRQILG